MVVADVMLREVEFVSPDATIQEAARLMGELDVAALPIGTREELLGIVTGRDILFRIVARGLDGTQVKTREVMSSTLFSCREDDTLQAALELMATHEVRRLPVIDAQSHVTGWVTAAQIAHRLLVEGELEPEILASFARLPQ